MNFQHPLHQQNLLRAALATLCACALSAAVTPAHSAEIIPSLGITRPVHAGSDNAQLFGGVAFRGDLAPAIKSEIGVAYRQESRLDGNLKVQQWPITASLWLAPSSNFYVGGGGGWYQTTYNYSSSVP